MTRSFHRAQVLFPAFILLLLLVPLAAAFAQQEQQAGWLTYEHPRGFKVSHPADWVIYDDNGTGSSVIFEHPQAAASKQDRNDDGVYALFTIQSEVYPPQNSAEDVLRQYLDIKRLFSDFRIVEANTTSLGGLPAAEKAVFTYTIGDVEFKEAVITAKKGNNDDGYTVRYTTYSSDFSKFLPTFEKMLASVEITPS
jgi:hypothetical protein